MCSRALSASCTACSCISHICVAQVPRALRADESRDLYASVPHSGALCPLSISALVAHILCVSVPFLPSPQHIECSFVILAHLRDQKNEMG